MKFLLLSFLLPAMVFGAPFRKRQATQEYVYDYTVSGGSSASAIDLSAISGKVPLPTGAVVTNVYWKVVTPLTSSGNASVTVGPSADADGYMAAQAHNMLYSNGVSSSHESAAALLWDDTNDADKAYYVSGTSAGDFKITFNKDVTAGKILFWVDFYYPSL